MCKNTKDEININFEVEKLQLLISNRFRNDLDLSIYLVLADFPGFKYHCNITLLLLKLNTLKKPYLFGLRSNLIQIVKPWRIRSKSVNTI